MVSKRARSVREVHLEREDGRWGAKSHAGSDIIALLERYMKNIQQGARRGRNRQSTGRGRRANSDGTTRKDGCWKCGHFQRDCSNATTTSEEAVVTTAGAVAASTTQDRRNEQ